MRIIEIINTKATNREKTPAGVDKVVWIICLPVMSDARSTGE